MNGLSRSPRRVPNVASPNSTSRQSADFGLGSSESAMELDNVALDAEEDLRQEPSMTISEKLAAVEAEAAEAHRNPPSPHVDTISKKRKYGANAAKTRKASRRRSTLSPEELAELKGLE
ncbi:uncharacterized protein A1O5_12733 [Cladophialophora psammophila CBS 110553]|uniref:Uncharacterized protein n=1 Tax=Cladophialophora psammophila CBS 110553 TaxID=1182543 RepID=W9W8V7_9EURO|nr:uncharacterized protein A1O5_12733 [Cladophialophora psammophila CBS 110553]EXJ54994.1 hypothetical protein A1O5_12733 [Cladophialophora psammophila CBS 110553]